MGNEHFIYIDGQHHWWLAKGNPYELEIHIIEEFPENQKMTWPEDFVAHMNMCAPWILFYDENNNLCGTPANARKIVQN